jgi:Reverse transcriptase (RNA-dependent DNA polymerase)
MDVRDGYWTIPLAERARHVTALRTVVGLFQYCRMAMGLRNASPFFQRYMNGFLADCRFVHSTAYHDDVNAATDTAAEHVVTDDKILSRTEAAGLKLKLRNCRFA